MKHNILKLIGRALLLPIMLLSCEVIAQVRYERLTLDAAINKAKKDGKMVLMLGTSSKSRQTLKMEEKCFNSRELSEYIVSKFVFIRCNFDIDNNQAIADKYDIVAYPSLIVIDVNGNELTRSQGAPRDADRFITNVETSLKEENRWAYHEAKFKADPKGYGQRYVEKLNSSYRLKRSKEVFIEQFNLHTIDENFSYINMLTYNNNVREMDDFIIQYMLKYPSDVKRVIGSEAYDKFIVTKVSRYLELALLRAKKLEDLESKLSIVAKSKGLHTESYEYINTNKKILVERSAKDILKAVNDIVETTSLLDLYNIVRTSIYAAQKGADFNRVKGRFVSMLKRAKLRDPKNSEDYDRFIKKFSNGKKDKEGDGSVVKITISD